MKTLLAAILPFVFASCSNVDLEVKTENSKPLVGDLNDDGLPDVLLIPSSDATPVLSDEALARIERFANEQMYRTIVIAEK